MQLTSSYYMGGLACLVVSYHPEAPTQLLSQAHPHILHTPHRSPVGLVFFPWPWLCDTVAVPRLPTCLGGTPQQQPWSVRLLTPLTKWLS